MPSELCKGGAAKASVGFLEELLFEDTCCPFQFLDFLVTYTIARCFVCRQHVESVQCCRNCYC